MSIGLSAHIYPSRSLACLLASLLVLATAAIWKAAEEWFVGLWPAVLAQLSGFALLMFCIIWYRRYARVQVLIVSDSGNMAMIPDWHGAPERACKVVSSGHPVIWPWLIALSLRDESGAMRRLLVLPDSTDENSFRRLRVALLWIHGRMPVQ